ncbi:MAG: hypothetical protein JXR96_11310 [Deltaproteobacteria bacterium]|nr:hypothetical protein [Deltaproteobacteria bacterium]
MRSLSVKCRGLTPFLLCLACSSGGSATDAGPGDGDGGGGDAGPGCGDSAWVCLRVESPASLCSCFEDYAGWAQERDALGRLELLAGLFDLPEALSESELGLVERLTRRGGVYLPAGPGRLTHEVSTHVSPTTHYYSLEQELESGGQRFTAGLEASFQVDENGRPYSPAIVIDEAFMPGAAWIRVVDPDAPERNRSYASCGYPTLPLVVIAAEAEGGDRLVLHKRFTEPMAGSAPARIVHAEVSVSGQERSVDDFFCLVYAAEHHNWNETLVVLLDPPMGEVGGLLLQEHDYWEDPIELVYLDSQGGELRRAALVSYSEGQ